MARKPPEPTSRKQNEIPPADNGAVPFQSNNPDVLRMLEESKADLKRERHGDRDKFEVAFNDADRLYHVKVVLEFSTEQFDGFAGAIGRSHTVANDLLHLHGHRDAGMAWFDAQEKLAEIESSRRNLSWQVFARATRLIRKTTRSKGKTDNDDKAANDAEASKQQQTGGQDQIAQITTQELDVLKAEVEELRRERDAARAELERVKAAQKDGEEAAPNG